MVSLATFKILINVCTNSVFFTDRQTMGDILVPKVPPESPMQRKGFLPILAHDNGTVAPDSTGEILDQKTVGLPEVDVGAATVVVRVADGCRTAVAVVAINENLRDVWRTHRPCRIAGE
ncbi:MAG: hypothetical protein BWY72_02377 [Bacteroidetes bacterium ADurb.Bin416]|nr:MAG: hypothetical protein BWY72_02377 [Bacteroidetes bacterium ADurb.Bin416]